jgi:hypothetical protein
MIIKISEGYEYSLALSCESFVYIMKSIKL